MNALAHRLGTRRKIYIELLTRWAKILVGSSYWHKPVGLNPAFRPGRLEGYYNNYSVKVNWPGPVDEDGIPLNHTVDGNAYYFPLTILQKALGHWEAWLASGRGEESHREQFLKFARWAVERQDERGGWPTWPDCGVRAATPYSAMTQGQAVSVLVRAYVVTADDGFLRAGARAIELMTATIENGGTARHSVHGPVLEEVPLIPSRTVLNGWINGVYGLYDFLLVQRSEEVLNTLGATLTALTEYLPQYDAKYWSYYDTGGNVASPYYHARHIAQLKACEDTFSQYSVEFRTMREKFERQAASSANRLRAIVVKGVQKLRNPPEAVVK